MTLTPRILAAMIPLVLSCGAPSIAQQFLESPRAGIVLVTAKFEGGGASAWPRAETARAGRDGRVTGSGFVLGRSGYVLTSAALVVPKDRDVFVDTLEVVVVEGIADPDPDELARENEFLEPEPVYLTTRYAASLLEIDEELGVALLEIEPDAELPALRLGDSGVVSDGQRLSVLGREHDGRLIESAVTVRTPERDDLEDLATLALGGRVDAAAEGGPVVDGEGYVIGVVARGGPGEGLVAIPVNALKGFVAGQPAAAELPWELVLGPWQRLEGEGLRLRTVEGLWDVWPGRTRYETARDARGVSLRIDRFASPLELGPLEARLLEGGFGSPPAVRAADGSSEERAVRRSKSRLLGSARAEVDGEKHAIEYLIARVGQERIVARYEAPEEIAAYNRSVLWASLYEMRVVRMLMQEVSRSLAIRTEPGGFEIGGAPEVVMPAGWHVEPAVAELLPDLPSPDDVLSASPESDYTVSFTAYYWADGLAAERVVPADVGQVREFGLYGLPYVSRVMSIPVGEASTVVLECRAPAEKADLVRDACERWVSAATGRLSE